MTVHNGARLADLSQVPEPLRREIRIVSQVLPFKVNDYVLELIDWGEVPNDPIYRLTFPSRKMISEADYRTVERLLDRGASQTEVRAVTDEVRWRLNPHPGHQLTKNAATLDGETFPGLQHKYRETVLAFPARGQTCHAYCGYCFRWAQFVGMPGLRQANPDAGLLVRYLRGHPHVTDVLITGGDPMIMSTRRLATWLEPLLAPELAHVGTIRLGTKALSYWPNRFLTDRDADDLLRLLERCVRSGKHVAFMAHFSHARELTMDAVQEAIRRIRATGAVIRTQAPVIRHVNDTAEAWANMWRQQVQLGCLPYYMFVERDTGARSYYELPLAEALEIYRGAITQLSGLARHARGPSMSASPGKVCIDGVAEVRGEKVFCLRLLQARNPDWVGRPFFARFDPTATWLDGLQPAFGEPSFFFENDPVQDWRDRPRRPRRRGPEHKLPLASRAY